MRRWDWNVAVYWIAGQALALFSVFVLEHQWYTIILGAVVSGLFIAWLRRRKPYAMTWGDTYVPGTTTTINEYRAERNLPPL